MKLVAVMFLMVACICCAGVSAEARQGGLLEMLRDRYIQRRITMLDAKLPTTTPIVVMLSAALVASAAAQGISLEILNELTPQDLELLQAAFTGQPLPK